VRLAGLAPGLRLRGGKRPGASDGAGDDLQIDDEHLRIHGKGGTVRTVLLDDRGYVAMLRLYLARGSPTTR
jgi:hypothetical protein